MNRSSIVAVASSASDLEAVSELLCALPDERDQIVVIVQYLDPARREVSMAEGLTRRTGLQMEVAQDGVVPERGHIYVLRANSTLTVVDGRLKLSAVASLLRGPGDMLLTSLAKDLGAEAIGVVLSGGGSDGALGVQAIKMAGGTTFAQFPGAARFPSMPISAIETGCVGSVLRPYEIARELTRRELLKTDSVNMPLQSVG